MNRFVGAVIRCEQSGSISLVDIDIGGLQLSATLLGIEAGWNEGTPVEVIFKEAETSLGKHLGGMISLRNRIPSTVTHIDRGHILSRIDLDHRGHPLSAIITTRSVDALALAVGDEVEALIKANELTLQHYRGVS